MKHTIDYDQLGMDWVGDWAGQRRRLTPERLALIQPETQRRLNYRQLDDAARSFAQWLHNKAQLKPGDVIALIALNRAESLILYLACGKLGLVLAPISQRLGHEEAASLLTRLKPQLVVYDTELADRVYALKSVIGACRSLSVGGAKSDYQREVVGIQPDRINRPVAMAETSLLVHTGGSTGLPKICAISYRQMLWNAFELMTAAPEGLGNRREMVLFPLYHIGGWNSVMPILQAGGCVVLPERFAPEAALACIADESINHFGAVEAMLQAMIACPTFAQTPLQTLDGITTAGAPCAPATMEAFFARGVPISQAYGLTEAGPSNLYNLRAGQSLEALRATSASVGHALLYSDYCITNTTTGSRVAEGEVGELYLRSAHNFSGYWDDPQQTADRMSADGWVGTGDLAKARPDGRLELVGRVDNLLVIGGENVAAEALERLLEGHAKINQALVFGIADARWGERAVACVVGPEPQAVAALNQWARQTLAPYQCPIDWQMLDALPLTGAGKLDRRQARADYLAQAIGDKP